MPTRMRIGSTNSGPPHQRTPASCSMRLPIPRWSIKHSGNSMSLEADADASWHLRLAITALAEHHDRDTTVKMNEVKPASATAARRPLLELEQHRGFVDRHIGTDAADQAQMLEVLGYASRA